MEMGGGFLLEADIASLQGTIAAPSFYAQDDELVQRKLHELTDAEARLEQRIERWGELETLRDSLLR